MERCDENKKNDQEILIIEKRGSPIKYLKEADKQFIYQIENEKHAEVILDLKNKKVDLEVMIQRIKFSLKATYRENISRLTL